MLQSGLLDDEELLDEMPIPTPTPPVLDDEFDDIDIEDGKKVGLAVLFWGMIILITGVVLFGIWYFSRKQVFLTRVLRQVVRIYEKRERGIPQWIIRWLAWLEARPMMRAFHAINRALRWLHGDVPPHLTPTERATLLATLLPDLEDDILQLLREHEKTLFTPDVGDIEIAQDAGARITWAALKQRMQVRSKETDV